MLASLKAFHVATVDLRLRALATQQEIMETEKPELLVKAFLVLKEPFMQRAVERHA